MDFQELDFVSMEVMKMSGVIFSIPSVWYDFEHFGYKDLWNYLKKIKIIENMTEVTLKTILHMISKA